MNQASGFSEEPFHQQNIRFQLRIGCAGCSSRRCSSVNARRGSIPSSRSRTSLAGDIEPTHARAGLARPPFVVLLVADAASGKPSRNNVVISGFGFVHGLVLLGTGACGRDRRRPTKESLRLDPRDAGRWPPLPTSGRLLSLDIRRDPAPLSPPAGQEGPGERGGNSGIRPCSFPGLRESNRRPHHSSASTKRLPKARPSSLPQGREWRDSSAVAPRARRFPAREPRLAKDRLRAPGGSTRPLGSGRPGDGEPCRHRRRGIRDRLVGRPASTPKSPDNASLALNNASSSVSPSVIGPFHIDEAHENRRFASGFQHGGIARSRRSERRCPPYAAAGSVGSGSGSGSA